MQHDRPDIFVLDKKKNEITLIEVGITNLDLLKQVENEKVWLGSQWISHKSQMQSENYPIYDHF